MTKDEVDQMTVQEAVEYSMARLVQQGQRCVTIDGCAYGNTVGHHCAIGWLLDDTDPELMGFRGGVQTLIKRFRDRLPRLIVEHQKVFSEFQHFHDLHGRNRRRYQAEYLQRLGLTPTPDWSAWIALGDPWDDRSSTMP